MQEAFAVFGLLTAYGLDGNILTAYEFLIDNYEDDDEIFLFGFSRGAHTVRILAALIHKIGLLRREQSNLTGIGLRAYEQFSAFEQPQASALLQQIIDEGDTEGPQPLTQDDPAAQFGRVVSSRWPTIRMLGVWDTVASVIVPRPDRLYFPSLEAELAYTQLNPSVRAFRQAISIDERRRMFRLKPWSEPQAFVRHRFNRVISHEPQDIKQVWFAGVHADVGGGYRERESALSKFPLLWMIEEAVNCGLAVNLPTVNMLAWGRQRRSSAYTYVAPDVRGELHNSISAGWHPPEFFPKSDKHKEWPSRRSLFGFYIPNAEPRLIPENSLVHESVVKRMEALPEYRPINLPSQYCTIAMSEPPQFTDV